MKLNLSTPSFSDLNIEVSEVTLQTPKGETLILPGHTSLICELSAGSLSYKTIQGELKQYQSGKGFLKIKDNELNVLADSLT